MAAAAPPLATPEDYTTLVGLSPAGVDVGAQLIAASAAVRRYCGWVIGPRETATFVLDGSGGQSLLLPTLKLIDVVSVVSDTAVIDPLDLQWSADGYLRTAGWWSSRLRGVIVVAEHGFDLIDVYDVVQIVCDIAARSVAVPAGVASESSLSQSISYVQTPLMQDELARLAMYRLPRRF